MNFTSPAVSRQCSFSTWVIGRRCALAREGDLQTCFLQHPGECVPPRVGAVLRGWSSVVAAVCIFSSGSALVSFGQTSSRLPPWRPSSIPSTSFFPNFIARASHDLWHECPRLRSRLFLKPSVAASHAQLSSLSRCIRILSLPHAPGRGKMLNVGARESSRSGMMS